MSAIYPWIEGHPVVGVPKVSVTPNLAGLYVHNPGRLGWAGWARKILEANPHMVEAIDTLHSSMHPELGPGRGPRVRHVRDIPMERGSVRPTMRDDLERFS